MFGPRVQVGPPGTTPHRHGERASKLSGGQQQRVALARAFVFSPAVLLFDEPLSNLDAKLRAEMRLEIEELQHKLGITSVYVTHDLEEALAISDRIVVMRNGIIEQIGGPADRYYGTAFGRLVGTDGVFSVRTIHMSPRGGLPPPSLMKISGRPATLDMCTAPYGRVSPGAWSPHLSLTWASRGTIVCCRREVSTQARV